MTQFTTSIPAQRQQQISDYLKSKFSISIKEASELCNVSEATARRDLDDMAGFWSAHMEGRCFIRGRALKSITMKR